MALAHSQAYSFFHWERAYDANADGINDGITREWFYRMKSAFVAAGWTVMGSYLGSGTLYNDGDRDLVDGLGAGAGTDVWTVPVMANSTLRPWVVLQCPPAMGVIQMALGTSQPWNNNPEYVVYRTSHSGSFMATPGYGGADGTTTNPPTAPDQVTHRNSGAGGMDSEGDYTASIHACWSADKTQFYCATFQEQGNPFFFAFSVLDNAPAELDGGLVWTMTDGGSPYDILSETKMDSGDHYTTASWNGSISGVNRTLYLGGRGYANAGIHNHLRIPQDRSTVFSPCELYCNTATIQGYYGTVPDLYWGPVNQYRQGFGDTPGGPINWLSGASLVMPWDFEEPLPRVR